MPREYAGGAKRTKLVGDITAASTTFAVTDATGWPTGAVGPFAIAFELGVAGEEKVLIASRSGNTLTVAASGRGYDGTTAASHQSGANVDHVITAIDIREATSVTTTEGVAFDSARLGGVAAPNYYTISQSNAAYVAQTLVDAKGDLLVGSAADTVVRRAVGANGTVLTADSAEASGVKWTTPAASAPELGYTQVTTSQTGITTPTDLTGLSVAVTVGASPVKVTGALNIVKDATGGKVSLSIIDATSSAILLTRSVTLAANADGHFDFSVRVAPAAGARTYKLQMTTAAGAVSTSAAADMPAYIQVATA